MTPRRKTSEQGRRRQRRRRSQGSRWVQQSEEPSVTRWDAAMSRRRSGASPNVQEDPADRGTAKQARHRGHDNDLYRCAGTENADRCEGEGRTPASLLGPLHPCVEARCAEGGVPALRQVIDDGAGVRGYFAWISVIQSCSASACTTHSSNAATTQDGSRSA